MGAVVVGEGHQDHEDDGHHREDQDTGERQSQQGLVKLFVHQTAQVIRTGFQALALALMLLGDLVLLDVQAPGVHKGHNEEDGQHAIEQDLEGVVPVDLGIGVQNGAVFIVGANLAQGRKHAHPVAAGGDHVEDEHDLEEQKQQAAKHLSAGHAAKAHHQEGGPGLPVSFLEGGKDIGKLLSDPQSQITEETADGEEKAADCSGDRGKEACELVKEFLSLAQLEKFQVTVSFHIIAPFIKWLEPKPDSNHSFGSAKVND